MYKCTLMVYNFSSTVSKFQRLGKYTEKMINVQDAPVCDATMLNPIAIGWNTEAGNPKKSEPRFCRIYMIF